MRTQQFAHHFGGWRPSAAPPRTARFGAVHRTHVPHPVLVDLRDRLPEAWNQGHLGSCTGFAGKALLMAETDCSPRSELDLYWKERQILHTPDEDSGASMHDCMDVVCAGVGPEDLWPYDIGKFTQSPPSAEDNPAVQVKLGSRAELQTTEDMLDCLASGHGFIFGFQVFASFDSEFTDRTGLVTMPLRGERYEGGHAQYACGYHLDFMASETFDRIGLPPAERHSYWSKAVLVRNSWGVDWGQHGHSWFPLEFLSTPRLASEFLTGRA